MGSSATRRPYKLHEQALKKVNKLGKKGKDAVDFSSITVLIVAKGEPLTTTASEQPRRPTLV